MANRTLLEQVLLAQDSHTYRRATFQRFRQSGRGDETTPVATGNPVCLGAL